MSLYRSLQSLERQGAPLRVALVGAGSMGMGVAIQIRETPGMVLVAVADIDARRAEAAAALYQRPSWSHSREIHRSDFGPATGKDIIPILQSDGGKIDVLVEATNTVAYAAAASLAALENRIHVVLMNAEVDLLLGPLLHKAASQHGVLISSDAGDQHGVIMRMLEEISLWGFRPVMAGNIKGFLNRYATAASLVEEAAIRNLNPIQCAAYTDGTKLNIEMALISAATGMEPFCCGMEGPRAGDVTEVFEKFDFTRYDEKGVVDYILGASPGGGVYVVGYCDDPVQMSYLKYYKLGNGPYYLFYRPYHLCHLETPRAIAKLCLHGRPVLEPVYGMRSSVIAFAKRELKKGEAIERGIGSDHFYGMIDLDENAAALHAVPIALIEPEDGEKWHVSRPVPKDGVVTFDDLEIPETRLCALYQEQTRLSHSGVIRGQGLSVYPD